MSAAHEPFPLSGVKRTRGSLPKRTEEERKARSEALKRALDLMETITDETDTDENWREVMRGIDEGRPHRPLFKGHY
jgi:hypothetical protein